MDTNSFISADGRYVVFASYASLVTNDTNGVTDIYVHDQQTSQTARLSVDINGNQVQGYSWFPSISADGHYVVFASWAEDLVLGDTNRERDIFVARR
jgi:Tol biopolymer transport system component